MNILSSLSNFYNNLSSDGVFFFWIVVFLFCFLIFLSVVLFIKNKKLSKLLEEEIDDNFLGDNDNIEIRENKKEEELPSVKEEIKVEKNKEPKIEIPKEEIIEKPIIEEKPKLYNKNVLREMNARMQTSPINIENKNKVKEEPDYDMPEYNLREESSISPLEMMEDVYEVNDNMKFASEIVEKMEEEIKPSNIELTDYEKKQEEEAIISYDELMKVKDKIYNITEEEETDEFIDELKSFRLDL